jgi:hypothetical protein
MGRVDHDGLLSRYRIYLQDRSVWAAAFRAQLDAMEAGFYAKLEAEA